MTKQNINFCLLPFPLHWHISHERAITDHIKYIISESTISKDSKSEISTFIAVFWQNISSNTHKTNNNYNLHGLAKKKKN